jgi:hypothetical protein
MQKGGVWRYGTSEWLLCARGGRGEAPADEWRNSLQMQCIRLHSWEYASNVQRDTRSAAAPESNLSEAGWSWRCVSGLDSNGQTMFTVDTRRDGKRFVVRADEKLTAFVEFESAIGATNNGGSSSRLQTAPSQRKNYKYFDDFPELGIPKSRSWLYDAALRLACAAQ